MDRYFRTCCCRYGAILVTARVSHASGALGMGIPVSVQVDNNSRRDAKVVVHLTKVSLVLQLILITI